MANSCNPQRSKVLTPAFQRVEVQRQQLEAMKAGDEPFRAMNGFLKFMSGFVSLDNLATTWPQLRPYVNALKTGEQIRSRLNYEYAESMRKVADLDTKEGRAITRIMEVEDAEGRLATENADGTATITAQQDHVGVKQGETVTLPKKLNDTRKEMRRVMDELFTHMIDSTKVAMGYGPNETPMGRDALLLRRMESIRKAGYIPHIRKGRWGITYNLNGQMHLQDFGWNPIKGFQGGGKQQALKRIEDGRGRNRGGRAGERVAAVQTSRGAHQLGALERLQHLADRWQGNPRPFSQRGSAVQGQRRAGHFCQQHGGVVGHFADADHKTGPF